MCKPVFNRELISVADIVDWHGPDGLFSHVSYRVFPTVFSSSIAALLLSGLYFHPEPARGKLFAKDRLSRQLRDVGGALLSYPTPWVSSQTQAHSFGATDLRLYEGQEAPNSKASSILRTDSDVLFGAFVLFATELELDSANPESLTQYIESSPLPLFDSLRWVFLARVEERRGETESAIRAQAEIEGSGLNAAQAAFVSQWARQEIHLVGNQGPANDDDYEESSAHREYYIG